MAATKKRTAKLAPGDTGISSHAPSVRVFTDWTPDRIRSAERQAEAGNLSSAVAICEWLLSDDRVVAALDARIDALMGLEPTFEPGKGKRADEAAKLLDEEDWWAAYPESELKQLLRWGILLGVAPARHNWAERVDHGGRVLPMPQFWHPQTLRWDAQVRKWFVRDDRHVELEVIPGDGEWILHTPSGKSRPWAHGLWRSLARWALVKVLAQSDWARHSEKASLVAVTAPEKATKEQRREVANDLYSRGADAVVALAAGFDIKMVEVSADTKAIYQAQIDAANDAIAIRIRGSNLTTEVKAGAGSKAATEAQAKTGDGPKLKADATALSTTLNEQSLTPWAEYNFGDRSAAPWPAWPVEPEEDKSARASMVKTLGEGLTTWDKLGFDIDPEAVQEEFGLSFLAGRSREREPEPVPGVPGQGEDGDEPKADPKKASARATVAPGKPGTNNSRAGADMPRLEANGFVQGQTYADDLVDSGQAAAGEAISPLVDGILALVNEAKDYDSLRRGVLKLWGDSLPPEQLRDVLQKCLVLAELAGHYAVKQDSD